MKAAFFTLGCKVNQYESQAMAEQLMRRGFEIVDSGEPADVYVINSCTVTSESDRKTRQTVRRFKKLHPSSIIVLTGCVPQAFPQACEALEQADIVLGNNSNDTLADAIEAFSRGKKRIIGIKAHKSGEAFSSGAVTSFFERTRANVKIEDGCNRFCSYCIIPYARGRVRSKPLDELESELKALADKGFKEIVLVGINLSAYGTDCGKSIVDAVRLACSFDSIKRVRLGSLEPDHITDEIIEALSEMPKFCPQFHISLQSGCTQTLKRMNRHYDAGEYAELCSKLRSHFKDATITTDVMVGFPGETREEFAQSIEFVKKIGFEKVHIFPYSRREGTPAAKMPEQVKNSEKAARAAEMSAAAEEIRNRFLNMQVGRVLQVIPEEYSNGESHGYTANYTPVTIIGTVEYGNVVNVRITGVSGDRCIGEPIEI